MAKHDGSFRSEYCGVLQYYCFRTGNLARFNDLIPLPMMFYHREDRYNAILYRDVQHLLGKPFSLSPRGNFERIERVHSALLPILFNAFEDPAEPPEPHLSSLAMNSAENDRISSFNESSTHHRA